MNFNRLHSAGLDVLGGEAATNRGILIKIRNAAELARSQGALASIAAQIAPATIEAKVYDEMRKRLASSLKDSHVEADVMIVEPTAFQTADGKHVAHDVGVGLVAAGGIVIGLAVLWKLAEYAMGHSLLPAHHGGRK